MSDKPKEGADPKIDKVIDTPLPDPLTSSEKDTFEKTIEAKDAEIERLQKLLEDKRQSDPPRSRKFNVGDFIPPIFK